MSQIILHSDLNNFYASVECLYRPELQLRPMAVGGNEEARHGIVLAKNQLAKQFGVQTGEALWQARQKCPDLVTVPPNFDRYIAFSKCARAIYSKYTDQIQSFGIDEAWLDVTGSVNLFGQGPKVANEIRERCRKEMGITVSVGVSYNKVFAKLGSDMKKPDATTVITLADYRHKVWPLPAGDLLYVGPATQRKLRRYGIYTIGQLAQTSTAALKGWLGSQGTMLWQFANGLDTSLVHVQGYESEVKSVGNSTTTPRDLTTNDDVHLTMRALSDSVAMRLREQQLRGKTVQIYVRDKDLHTYERQMALPMTTSLSDDILRAAMALFVDSYSWEKPIRSVGVRVTGLVADDKPQQLSFFEDNAHHFKREILEETIDSLRARYGYFCVRRGSVLLDKRLTRINPERDREIEHDKHLFPSFN